MNLENFIGRDIELNTLINAFDNCCEGNAQLLLIDGEIGIGKSAMIDKFIVREKNYCEIAVANCCLNYFPKAQSFEAVNEIAKSLAGEDFVVKNDSDFYNLICNKSKELPVLIVIDNANCIDNESLDIICSVSASLSKNSCKAMIVLSYCTRLDIDNSDSSDFSYFVSKVNELKQLKKADGEDFAIEVNIQPLKLADVAMYVFRRFSDNKFPSDFSNLLYKITKGHPMCLNEVLKYLIQCKNLLKDNGVWTLNGSDFSFLDITLSKIEKLRIEKLYDNFSKLDDKNISELLCPEEFDVISSLRDNYLYHIIISNADEDLLMKTVEKIQQALLQQNNPDFENVAKAIEDIKKHYGIKNDSQKTNLFDEFTSNGKLDSEKAKVQIEEILSRALQCKQQYQMRQVTDLADEVLLIINKIDSEDDITFNEQKFNAIQLKEEALSWLGFYHDALNLAEELRVLADKNKSEIQKHRAYFRTGVEQQFLSDYDNAVGNINTAISIAQKINDTDSIYRYANQLILTHVANFNLEGAQQAMSLTVGLSPSKKSISYEGILNKGIYKRYNSDYEGSVELLNSCIKPFEEENEKMLLAKTFNNLGLAYEEMGLYDKAEEFLKKAMEVDLEINDNINLSNRYNNIGLLKAAHNRIDEAMDYFRKSLKIDEFLNNLPKMAISYDNIGDIILKTGDLEKAKEYFDKAVEIHKKIGNERGLSLSYINLGNMYFLSDDSFEAKRYYSMALNIDIKYGEEQNILSDYQMLGNVFAQDNEYEKAEEYFNKAQAISEKLNDTQSLASLMNNLGNVYFNLRDYNRSMEYYKRALDINVKRGDKQSQSMNYNNIAGVHDNKGENFSAFINYKRAIKIDRELDDKLNLASHLDNFAISRFTYGNYDQAEGAYEESALIYKELGNEKQMIDSMRFAADCLRCKRKFAAAEKKLKEILNLCKENGDSYGLALTYVYLGTNYHDWERYKEALENFRSGANIFHDYDDKDPNYYSAINHIAFTNEAIGNNEEALLNHLQLLKVYDEAADYKKVAEKYMDIGKVYLKMNDKKTAENYFTRSIDSAEISNDLEQKALCYSNFGRYYCTINDLKNGTDMLVKAAELLDDNDNYAQECAKYYTQAADAYYNAHCYYNAIHYYNEASYIMSDHGYPDQLAYLYNNIGYTYDTMSQFNNAIDYYQQAYDCYKDVSNIDGMINNLKNVALMHERLENYSEAATYYRRVLDQLDDLDADAEKGEVCLDIAECCMKANSDYEESAKFAIRAYDFYKSDGNFEEQIHCLEVIALLYYSNNDVIKGDMYFKKLQQQEAYVNDNESKTQVYKSVSTILFHQGKFVESMETFFKAIALSMNMDKWEPLGENYYDLAQILISDETEFQTEVQFQGKTKTLAEFAIEYLESTIKVAKTENYAQLHAKALESLAHIYSIIGDVDLELAKYDEAQKVYEPNSKSRYAIILMAKAEAYIFRKKDYDTAEKLFLDALEIVDKLNSRELIATIQSCLALIYFKTGRTEEAKTLIRKIHKNYEYIIKNMPELMLYYNKMKEDPEEKFVDPSDQSEFSNIYNELMKMFDDSDDTTK